MKFFFIFAVIFTCKFYVDSVLIDKVSFQVRMLASVNQVRSMHHNTQSLSIADELTASAQEYSDILAQANNGLSRNENSLKLCGDRMRGYITDTQITTGIAACGETLGIVYSNKDLKEACKPDVFVQLWNSQRLFYNYSFPPYTSLDQVRFSDFTQLVWKSSRYIGVGVSMNAKQDVCFVTARFWQAGNILGEYEKNVTQKSSRIFSNYLLTYLSVLFIILLKKSA